MIMINGEKIDFKSFPNGELNLKKPVGLGYCKSVTLKYENDQDLTNLMFLKKGIGHAYLKLPYIPYSRMDRSSNSHVFTLKTFCEFINWLDFSQVIIMDAHSDVSEVLLNNLKKETVILGLMKQAGYRKEIDYILYPDASAFKRYGEVLKAPRYLMGFKERDFESGKITNYRISGEYKPQKGSRMYIVDDLCSKGGTFLLAGEHLEKLGVKESILVVAHCESSVEEGPIISSNLIKEIHTSDSIPRSPHLKIITYNLCKYE